jgi:hypothetical protein
LSKRFVFAVIFLLLLGNLLIASFKIQSARALDSGETLVPVPFDYQEKDYYCGPAALQMVFNYYGENISQYEIACVARSIGAPLYTTYTEELRRAGHFSSLSTSMGDELDSNITGYALRQLGYAAFEGYSDLTTLKNFLDQGKPLILLMWYSSAHVDGHYRVATGYNETDVFLNDPWNKPLWGGTYGGPNIAFNNSEFLDLWSYSDNWALYVSPWTVDFSAPVSVEVGTPFQVESTVTYPQPLPNALSAYPASSCNASITLPPNLSLAQGENQQKTVGTGDLQAGDSSSLSWTLVANSSVAGTVSITVDGMISGSVGANSNYPAYDYSDRIGATVNFTVNIAVGHNIAVTSILSSKTIVGQGYSLNISVTVANQGIYAENFNVTTYANTTGIQTDNITLTSATSTTITIVLNTTGLAYGNYTLSAYAWPVSGETNTADNNMTGGTINVSIPGDINGDGTVDIFDAIKLAVAFNATPSKPNWNPNADINGDGTVDFYDATILSGYFNQHYP